MVKVKNIDIYNNRSWKKNLLEKIDSCSEEMAYRALSLSLSNERGNWLYGDRNWAGLKTSTNLMLFIILRF
jgi:hypothetical protein